jgi:DNA replication protein DnaC
MNNEQKPFSVTDLLAVNPEIRHEHCAEHGDYDSRNIIRNVWSGCPACAAHQQASRQIEEAEKAESERHQSWQRRLGEAGIPDRFKDRTLSAYRAVDDGQKHALEFAQSYADQFDKVVETGRSAIFCGRPGTGKTHLAVGVALQVMARGRCAMFTTVQRAMRRVKDTFRKGAEESESQAIAVLTYPDLLIIDEIGVQFGSEFEKNMMFDILNERYEKRRPTLLLSNLTAQEVKLFLGERIYDRLKEDGGQCVSFDWESYRGTVGCAA